MRAREGVRGCLTKLRRAGTLIQWEVPKQGCPGETEVISDAIRAAASGKNVYVTRADPAQQGRLILCYKRYSRVGDSPEIRGICTANNPTVSLEDDFLYEVFQTPEDAPREIKPLLRGKEAYEFSKDSMLQINRGC